MFAQKNRSTNYLVNRVIKDNLNKKGKEESKELFKAMEKVLGANEIITKKGGELKRIKDSKYYNKVKERLSGNSSSYVVAFLTKLEMNKQKSEDEDFFDEQLHLSLEEEFSKNLKSNPDTLYKSLKEGLEELESNPFERAKILEKMAQIGGYEEEIKELLLDEIYSLDIEEEKERESYNSMEDYYESISKSDKQIALESNVNTLNKVIVDSDEKFESTLQILSKQKNEDVQRNIASNYLENNKERSLDLVDEIGIDKSNKLIPDQYEIRRNDLGDIEIWNHTTPIDK